MTKINKLGKSTFVIAILSFLLVAVLAFGGTYAYFTAQSSKVEGSVTTGHLRITSIVDGSGEAKLTSATKTVQPNQTIFDDTTVKTTVNSNISYYTRVRFVVDVEKSAEAGHDHATDCEDNVTAPIEILKITVAESGASGSTSKWETAGSDAVADNTEIIYYQLAPTEITNGAEATVAADKTETFSFTIKINEWVGTTTDSAEGCPFWMDATISVSVIVEVLQADYLDQDATQGVAAFANGAAAAEAWTKALGVEKPAAQG